MIGVQSLTMAKRPFFFAAIFSGFLLLLAGNIAVAHMGAAGVVKQRMDAMSDIGKAMKEIGAMLRGRLSFDSNRVAANAQNIAAHGRAIPSLFPAGSGGGVSEAKNSIWTDRAAFDWIARDLVSNAEALAVTAATGDRAAVDARYKAVAATCKDCLRTFRAKKR